MDAVTQDSRIAPVRQELIIVVCRYEKGGGRLAGFLSVFFTRKPPGDARQRLTFLLVQEKVAKERHPELRHPTRRVGRLFLPPLLWCNQRVGRRQGAQPLGFMLKKNGAATAAPFVIVRMFCRVNQCCSWQSTTATAAMLTMSETSSPRCRT